MSNKYESRVKLKVRSVMIDAFLFDNTVQVIILSLSFFWSLCYERMNAQAFNRHMP